MRATIITVESLSPSSASVFYTFRFVICASSPTDDLSKEPKNVVDGASLPQATGKVNGRYLPLRSEAKYTDFSDLVRSDVFGIPLGIDLIKSYHR